jgi:hypothetical protein
MMSQKRVLDRLVCNEETSILAVTIGITCEFGIVLEHEMDLFAFGGREGR